MPDSELDVELPVADAMEQEQSLAPPADPEASPVGGSPAETLLEASEADYADQQSVVPYDDEDYR